MKLDLRKLFTREKRTFSRMAERFGCQIDGSLLMIDRMLSFDGRIIDFSAGGAMFRPKLAYLMDRRDVPICLRVADVEVFGRIMRTTPAGFGLRFDEPLEEEELLTLLGNDQSRKPEEDIEFFVE